MVENSNNSSIVGLWHTTFVSGGLVWDEAFEQWHSDGTELAIDNAVPPLLGNVCVGVYKQSGPRTFKLRHVTWNWDPKRRTVGRDFSVVDDGNCRSAWQHFFGHVRFR